MGCGSSVETDPKQTMAMATRLWKEIEENRSGHLTKEELSAYFVDDSDIAKRLITAIDVDSDGFVTQNEWKTYWIRVASHAEANSTTDMDLKKIEAQIKAKKAERKASRRNSTSEEKKTKRKRLTEIGIDRNKDGMVTEAELRTALEKKNGGPVDDKLVRDMMATLDSNKDGNLTMQDLSEGR